MAKVVFIRHGQADYTDIDAGSYIGHGRDLAPLSTKGKEQITQTAKDHRLQGSQMILSSPYTRALESAAILSRRLDLPIQVEVDLHEWNPDLTGQYASTEEAIALYQDFKSHGGQVPEGESRKWETKAALIQRVQASIQPYLHMDQIIVVCHSLIIHTLFPGVKLDNGDIHIVDL